MVLIETSVRTEGLNDHYSEGKRFKWTGYSGKKEDKRTDGRTEKLVRIRWKPSDDIKRVKE